VLHCDRQYQILSTASGDGTGARFCAPLPPWPPRLGGITSAPPRGHFCKKQFTKFFFVGWPWTFQLAPGSPGGVNGVVGSSKYWNCEDDIRFLFCQLFGPVNHRQNWKSWERSGKKLQVIIKLFLVWLSWSMILAPWPSLDYHDQWYFQKPS